MTRRPNLRLRALSALLAVVAASAALPGASAAATCQAWSGPPPAIGDEWSGFRDVVTLSDCRALAVGTFRDAGTERALIERWNGTRWTIVEAPDFGGTQEGLDAVSAVNGRDVWAVGAVVTGGGEDRPLALHWDGTSWTRISAPATGDSKFYDVDVIATDDVWAVGKRNIGGDEQLLIEHWNGVKWKVVPTPLDDTPGAVLIGVDAGGPGNVWAVGHILDGLQGEPLTMRWNGTEWRVKPAPTINDEYHELSDVVTISGKKAWAVGTTGGAIQESILLRWNGSAWKAVAHPEPGNDGTHLNALDATSASNVWAVGQTCELGVGCDSLVLHFDGTKWTALPSATAGTGSRFLGIDASSPTNVWAVGNASQVSGFTPFAVHCC
jgi:hypothetical protein